MTPSARSLLVAGAMTVVTLLGAYLGMGAISGAGADGEGQRIENVHTGDGSGPIGHADAEAVTTIVPATSSTAPSDEAAVPADDNVPASTNTTGPAPATDSTRESPPVAPDAESSSPDPGPIDPSSPTTEAADPTVEATAPSSPTTTSTTSSSTTTTLPVVTEPTTTTAGERPTDQSTVDVGALDPIEREIYRLTNELRADPDGPLARVSPMPPCVDDPFHAITVDEVTGHPTPLAPLELQQAVSSRMSRPWAADMDARYSLQHRSNGSQMEIYEQLGLEIAATGENIAWLTGYPDDEAARTHFEGWRESDTGHYCTMLSAAYTHIGVGHVKGSTRSWAVQNFYRER